jgi:hypothetical protein
VSLQWRASWPPDTQTKQIWENLNKLSTRHGLGLNVIFDGKETANLLKDYSKIYFWNETIP